MIQVLGLRKDYRIHKKEAGLWASLRSLVTRQAETVSALQGIDLSVSAGEIVGLVGANGAGKTTLVKCLAGILHPTSGEAKVLGYTPWQRHNPFRRQIALIMGQKAQLWWDLPASDGFLLLKEIYRLSEVEFRQSLGKLTEMLDAKAQMDIPIRRLSLGERMKMELIAALLHRPKVVFLDEPTIGLDLMAQKAIRKFILEYRELEKPAMLLTSHYMQDIESLCPRVVLMRQGRIVYDGALAELPAKQGRWRTLTVHLAEDTTISLPSDLAEVLPSESGTLRFRVRREDATRAAALALQTLPVADLSLSEEDIGELIEDWIRKERGPE